MRQYTILYRTKTGLKRIKVIKAIDIDDAIKIGEKFCSKMGRIFYAINIGVS